MLKPVLLIATACLVLLACSEKPESEHASAAAPAIEEQPPHPGAALVKANCHACHKPGLNGAPIIGNAKMWGPRVTQGEETLVQHAIHGFGLMPPRGGSALSDEQMAQAVNYMLSQLPVAP
ncbi:c-type cytochrome [Porticoccus sp.]